MSDPQRTILRAPRTLRRNLVLAVLLVLASGTFAARAGGVGAGVASVLGGLAGLGLLSNASRKGARRFVHDTRAREQQMASELEEFRRAETRLRAELRAAEAAHAESEERRRQAESSDRAKTAFLSSLSHELRTPLNNVLGMAGILIDTHLSENQADYARTIYGGAEALIAVVDDLLDLSRLDDGNLALDEREFEFGYCVEGVVETCAESARKRELAIDVDLDPSIPAWVTGDRRRVRQILLALLDRAIAGQDADAGPRSLRLSVRGEESTAAFATVRFEIGSPGAADSAARTSTAAPTEAVGLSLATQLVGLMGGTIRLGADGTSAEFDLRFATDRRGSDAPSEPGDGQLSGMRMLLVSASGGCEALARSTAGELGMELDVATTGTDALDLLKRHASSGRPHAAVAIDAELPDISGGQLAGILRDSAELREIGCILLQPPGHDARPEELSRQGFDAWLKKPLSEARLRTAVLHVTAEPLAALDRRETGGGVAEAEDALPHVGAHVLLAEDNLVNQRVTKLILERLGCRVSVARNGMQAIEQVMEDDFDVVLMDCLMPELNGFDATRAIRRLSDPRKSRIPIIALTAAADEADQRACLDAGMNTHVLKPVRSALLARVLLQWTADSVRNPKGIAMSEAPTIDPEVLASLKELGGDDARIFVEIVDLFLADTPARMRALECAQESGDLEAVAAAAHALKSSCGNLGAMALYGLFRDIESLGRNGDVDSVASLIPRVRSEFVRVEVALRRESSGENR
jgi:CheY-like chemotaxis protein/signal transduction histidine kinase/HPt (histidine-containing phosphotransfer) domain-containing protein